MADLIIKPNSATGDKLILQDRAGGAVLTTADSGATIANATLNSPTLVTPALGTPASGVMTNATGIPAAQISGVLPVGVTGGSGLNALSVDALNTASNSYAVARSVELSSLGVLKHMFFGASYTLTNNVSPSGSTWTLLTSWRKMNSTGTAGATDADPFGKIINNRWTPGFAGYYLCHLQICANAEHQVAIYASIRRSIDGAATGESGEGTVLNERGEGGSTYTSISCTGILPLDTNDSLEFFARVDSTGKTIYKCQGQGRQTKIFVAYLGSSAL